MSRRARSALAGLFALALLIALAAAAANAEAAGGPGTLDTSFGTNGVAQTGFGGAALAIEPNGEYVVAGQAQTGPNLNQDDFAVALLTTSGTLDPAFGHGGVVTTAFPAASDGAAADAVLVEPNGDILAGGEALVPGTTRNQPVVAQGALAQYNPGVPVVDQRLRADVGERGGPGAWSRCRR